MDFGRTKDRTRFRAGPRRHWLCAAAARPPGSIRRSPGLTTDLKIVVTHVSPTMTTLGNEPRIKFFLLGNSELARVIDRHDVDLVIHGHVHRGNTHGVTPGGTWSGTPPRMSAARCSTSTRPNCSQPGSRRRSRPSRDLDALPDQNQFGDAPARPPDQSPPSQPAGIRGALQRDPAPASGRAARRRSGRADRGDGISADRLDRDRLRDRRPDRGHPSLLREP